MCVCESRTATGDGMGVPVARGRQSGRAQGSRTSGAEARLRLGSSVGVRLYVSIQAHFDFRLRFGAVRATPASRDATADATSPAEPEPGRGPAAAARATNGTDAAVLFEVD